MPNLHIPSVQHMARNYSPAPWEIARDLIRLAENPPFFNYNPLFGAVRDLLMYGVPLDDILEGINRAVKRESVRKNFLEVLPLIESHFSEVRPDFINAVSARYYPIGKGLMIPFKPPMVYGVGGKLIFPWFMFWRTNPMTKNRMRLFISVVQEILAQDPDLEDAELQILDFSAPKAKESRCLKVSLARNYQPLSDGERTEMLEDFAAGFIMARDELRNRGAQSDDVGTARKDPDQGELF